MSINQMRNLVLKIILFFAMPALAIADVGLGGVATSLMEPVNLTTNFLHAACFIIGGAFLFASIVKYIEHRRSPTMIPLSTVVFLVIAGAILILIPILTK